MSKQIHILPDAVKNMIAAGEVVEGPFSVIKELMENAIDARAHAIHVEAEDSGLKRILVRDDGLGIYKEDLVYAIQEHATSKITTITDIESIASFGFRGEALSSIASISKLTLLSRTEDEAMGGRLVAESEKVTASDYAGPRGTTVIVENLFYNTPARKKFLRSKSVESRSIREVFLKIALAHPEIAFTLVLNGKKPLKIMKADSRFKRIEQVFGSHEAEGLYEDTVHDLQVEVTGYLSKPHFLKGSRSMQYLYVNRRPVEYKYFGFLLSRAYEAIAPKGKYPAAILYVDIKPDLVDVNIHPAKREIKFFDQKYIESILYGLAKKVLGSQEHTLHTSLFTHNTQEMPAHVREEGIPKQNTGEEFTANPDTGKSTPGQIQHDSRATAFSQMTPVHRQSESIPSREYTGHPLSKEHTPGMPAGRSIVREGETLYRAVQGEYDSTILGIIFGTYILVEKGQSLKIIDFHAAHERFLFDEIISRKSPIESQELLFPQMLELSIDHYEILMEHVDYIRNKGFDIEPFSDNSMVIRSVPTILQGIAMEDFFHDLIEALKNQEDHVEKITRTLAERIACFSAKRAHEQMTSSDLELLVEKTFSGKYELRCPHGRPYLYSIEAKDFEKLFKR